MKISTTHFPQLYQLYIACNEYLQVTGFDEEIIILILYFHIFHLTLRSLIFYIFIG